MDTITIQKQLLDKFQDIKVGFIIASSVEVCNTPQRIKKIARKQEVIIREDFLKSPMEKNKILQSWQKFCKDMKYPKDVEPANCATIKNIISGNHIPKINSIVDIANIGILKSFLPVGVFDKSKIEGSIELSLSKKNGSYIPLFENNPVTIPENEIIYSDEKGVFSRYNKDADRTKITDNTSKILFVVDGIDTSSDDEIMETLNELESLLLDVSPNSKIHKKSILSFNNQKEIL